MSEEHIKAWKKVIKTIDDSIDINNEEFGPQTLSASLKVAEKAGIYTPEPKPEPKNITGADLIKLAETRIGERYVYGAQADLDDSDYHGVWDCSLFVSWVVRQKTGKVYGCVNNSASSPDPYTGGWKQDVINGTVNRIPVSQAAKTKGAILLRYRENSKHIVFSNGDGTTVEAKGAAYGVCRGNVGNLSSWDYGILVKGVKYD